MVDLYYKLIKEGIRTINDVPTKYKTEVQEKLDADN